MTLSQPFLFQQFFLQPSSDPDQDACANHGNDRSSDQAPSLNSDNSQHDRPYNAADQAKDHVFDHTALTAHKLSGDPAGNSAQNQGP